VKPAAVERLLAQREAQHFGRHVEDPGVLAAIATLMNEKSPGSGNRGSSPASSTPTDQNRNQHARS
jgi:hypothetical protein